jgi:hypothetical protein
MTSETNANEGRPHVGIGKDSVNMASAIGVVVGGAAEGRIEVAWYGDVDLSGEQSDFFCRHQRLSPYPCLHTCRGPGQDGDHGDYRIVLDDVS